MSIIDTLIARRRILGNILRAAATAAAVLMLALTVRAMMLPKDAPADPAEQGPNASELILVDENTVYFEGAPDTVEMEEIDSTPVSAGSSVAFVGTEPRIEVTFLSDGRYDSGLPTALSQLSGEPGYDGTFACHACDMEGEYTAYYLAAGWDPSLLYRAITPKWTNSQPPVASKVDAALWEAYVDALAGAKG